MNKVTHEPSFSRQDIAQVVLIAVLVVAAFSIGTLYSPSGNNREPPSAPVVESRTEANHRLRLPEGEQVHSVFASGGPYGGSIYILSVVSDPRGVKTYTVRNVGNGIPFACIEEKKP